MNNLNAHEPYTAFENIQFNPTCLNSLLGINDNNNRSRNNENVDPNEIDFQNYQKCREQNQDIVYTRGDKNQNTFYILKNWKCHRNDQTEEYVSLGQKPCEYSFRDYINKVSASISEMEAQKISNLKNITDAEQKNVSLEQQIKRKQEEVHSLLLDIFDTIKLLHSYSISLTNILLDNIKICEYDNHLKVKVVDLSAKTIDDNAKESYINDINNLGKLFLSIVKLNEIQSIEETLKSIKQRDTYNSIFRIIHNDFISNLNWIEPYRKKLMADLILYLIKIDDCDSSTIKDFTMHPFFWDERNIEDFLRIINCRIDLQDKEKDVKVIKSRIEVLNECINYVNWDKNIGTFLSNYIQQPTDKDSKIMKCNDLIKFIRNKIAHKDDDTDNENIPFKSKPQNKPTSFLPSKPSEPKKMKQNEEEKEKKKDKKNLAKLWTFFNERGGPLSYFLLQFPNLIYELFTHFRSFEHKKIIQFYPVCFRTILPEEKMMHSYSSKLPPSNKTWKNNSIAESERKTAIQRNFNNRKS